MDNVIKLSENPKYIPIFKERRERYHDRQVAALEEKWGEEYGVMVEKAQRLVDFEGSDEFREYLEKSGWGDNYFLVEFLAGLYDLVMCMLTETDCSDGEYNLFLCRKENA